MPRATPRAADPTLSEELILWIWQTYGHFDEEAVQKAITDMQKISSGLHVARWGSPLELIR